jgi:hypothetical protein
VASIPELEGALARAQATHRESLGRLQSGFEGAARGEYAAAHEELLAAGRALALARGEEAAMPCEWEVPWDIGAPMPMLVASGWKTLLLYLAHTPDPQWDGTSVTPVDPASPTVQPIALAEFVGCSASKFGGPNNEVIHGHPLSGKGLEAYGAHLIANSRWLAEQEQINSVHDYYSPAKWRDLRHYMLLFHDEMFECLATAHRIEVFQDSFPNVLALATRRVLASADEDRWIGPAGCLSG